MGKALREKWGRLGEKEGRRLWIISSTEKQRTEGFPMRQRSGAAAMDAKFVSTA
jgi:hypothetical protein